MLININYIDKNKSTYRCDMCNRVINSNNKITLQTRQTSNTKKKWDLCEHCYDILDKSIKKRREKEVQKNEIRKYIKNQNNNEEWYIKNRR